MATAQPTIHWQWSISILRLLWCLKNGLGRRNEPFCCLLRQTIFEEGDTIYHPPSSARIIIPSHLQRRPEPAPQLTPQQSSSDTTTRRWKTTPSALQQFHLVGICCGRHLRRIISCRRRWCERSFCALRAFTTEETEEVECEGREEQRQERGDRIRSDWSCRQSVQAGEWFMFWFLVLIASQNYSNSNRTY